MIGLAVLAAQVRDLETATRLLTEVIDAEPPDHLSQAAFLLGLVREHQGAREAAVRALQGAADSGHEQWAPKARAALDRLGT